MLTTILKSDRFDLKGHVPQCIVLRTQDEKPLDDAHRFMTHLQGISDTGEEFTVTGNYDQTLLEALEDFDRRVSFLAKWKEIQESEVNDNN